MWQQVDSNNELYDYMHKLRCIIAATPADQITVNAGQGKNSYEELAKILNLGPF